MTIFDALSDDSLAVHGLGPTKRNGKFAEPTFDGKARRLPPSPPAPRNDLGALESTIAKQSAELTLRLENEKAALRKQLDKAIDDSGELSRRLLAIDTGFNDREIAITSALEKVEALNAELTAVSAERFTLVAQLKSEGQRHRRELAQQKSIFEKAQANIIEVFEARLRAERDAAQFKIQELVEEIARERLDHSAESRASAAMRREMTFLLPKLAARRNEPHAPERGANAL